MLAVSTSTSTSSAAGSGTDTSSRRRPGSDAGFRSASIVSPIGAIMPIPDRRCGLSRMQIGPLPTRLSACTTRPSKRGRDYPNRGSER